MASDEQSQIDDLKKQIKQLTSEFQNLKKTIESFSRLPAVEKRIAAIENAVKKISSDIAPISKLPELSDMPKRLTNIEDTLFKLNETVSPVSTLSELPEFAKRLETIEVSFSEINEKIFVLSNFDEMMNSVARLEKRLEEVYNVVSEEKLEQQINTIVERMSQLEGFEKKFQDVLTTSDEVREIVSIIVRQLDDVERKYNRALNELSEGIRLVKELAQATTTVSAAPKAAPSSPETPLSSVTKKKKTEVKAKKSLPSTIDAIMEDLLEMVSPRTEAIEMAHALEEARDQLTEIIEEHTPVIFQFGKFARELKSYPPTATLNENDIARLNKEIRNWTSKLKELAKNK